jgi:hypothetical protein
MPSDDLSRLYDFIAGTTIVADQVDAELNQLINTMNNKVGRATTETINGIKTFSAANSHTGNNTFSGQNTFSDATAPILIDLLTERTANNGILVDGCLIQDGNVRLGTTRATVTLSTGVNTGTDVITTNAAHGLSTADPVRVRATAGSTLPTGLSATTQYYARNVSSTTITLHPTAADATGNLNIVNITAVGSGTMWIIGDEVSPADGDIWYNDGFKIRHLGATSTLATRGSGMVVQVVTATKTDTFSTSSTTYTDVTGLTASITPSSASSRILVLVSAMVASNSGAVQHSKIVRGVTDIFTGAAAGSRTVGSSGTFTAGTNEMQTFSVAAVDSPATTSSTTYKVQTRASAGANVYFNRNDSDTDASTNLRGFSSITLLEVL